ncbi:hypothetical protein COU60_02045 [Candidatus Pacearchaeota archaeon CG10_big_fil_rev_8_21_14_0_10_34_76]|nr:MAG: hypothetical protein COU60_02045 [Candidatus Pacearchaeota archaeon CG10_big_fil_rev_8_21_14_0_10_34_76]
MRKEVRLYLPASKLADFVDSVLHDGEVQELISKCLFTISAGVAPRNDSMDAFVQSLTSNGIKVARPISYAIEIAESIGFVKRTYQSLRVPITYLDEPKDFRDLFVKYLREEVLPENMWR